MIYISVFTMFRVLNYGGVCEKKVVYENEIIEHNPFPLKRGSQSRLVLLFFFSWCSSRSSAADSVHSPEVSSNMS